MKKIEANNRQIPTLKNMEQVYENYTNEDQEVWNILYNRQIENLQLTATSEYLKGIKHTNFTEDKIPNFEVTNSILKWMTGWELVAVEGIVDDQLFFELMANKKFPATTWIRKMSELDYLEEPDMFHDVFAHVPLLTNRPFTNFLQALSQIGHDHADDPVAIDLLSRVYWYTVEFGLIREKEGLRIYGAGILSSSGESKFALSDEPQLFDFDVSLIFDTPYRKDEFQEKYFIIDSFEQLFDSIEEIKTCLNIKREQMAQCG